MNYISKSSVATVTVPIPKTTGKKLAHAKFSPEAAGAQAARIALGELVVTPTLEQACTMVGANREYARRAVKHLTSEERKRVAHGVGVLPDVPPAAPAKTKPDFAVIDWSVNDLIALFKTLSPEEQATFGTGVGPADLWDGAIVPNL
jgi:hypothetical protein